MLLWHPGRFNIYCGPTIKKQMVRYYGLYKVRVANNQSTFVFSLTLNVVSDKKTYLVDGMDEVVYIRLIHKYHVVLSDLALA